MSELKIKAKINGIDVEVAQGTTILEAAEDTQIKIPTLCKHDDLPASAGCGLCIVKIAGNNKMLRACCTDVTEGMDITTHDAEIVEIRRTVLELILSDHPDDCLVCGRNQNCELQSLASDFGIRDNAFNKCLRDLPKDATTKTIVLEPDKCIKCGRCVEVCQEVQDVWALNFVSRGINTRIAPAGDIKLADSPCVRCGQCSAHCPTGAIMEYSECSKAWNEIKNTDKHCIVQIAPAVRVAIGEAFGFEPGEITTGKLYTALRRLGFDTVFDTNFGADLTIMEEGSEFVSRLTKQTGPLPLITSCCPAWVDYMEKYYGNAIDLFSTCKSPHEMVGVLAKTYFADKQNIKKENICMVSIMPCTAKKYEIQRDTHMSASGVQDIDISLTTRELARMIKQAGIDFKNLPEEEPDNILGKYAGAGTIFGATGGVMEAAIRTAYTLVTNEELENVNIDVVRGLEGIKEGEIDIKGTKIRVAVAHGLGNVKHLLDKVIAAKEAGEEPPYHFIEVMACTGGCISGGGQPYGVTNAIRKKRTAGIYKDDEQQEIRCSHQNPFINKLYEDFLEKPLSHKSHELLHTKYVDRPIYLK